MKKKRKPRKRIGTSLGLVGALLNMALLNMALLPVAAAPKKKPVLETYALLSGSVFNDSGLALPDVDVTVAPEAAQTNKTKPLEAVSDARGEFIVRVPPGPANYIVAVIAKGFQSQRKTVAVNDQERVEVTFQLQRESK